MEHQIYHFFYGPQSINHKLFMLVNHTNAPLLDTIMPVFTLLGGSRLVYLYFLILAVWYFVDKKAMPGRYLVVYFVATFFSLGVEEALKGLTHVPRPPVAIGPTHVRVLGRMSSSFSFPSGHAIFSFMSAYTLSHGRSWRWKGVLFLFAACVAYSRVYVGAHYPLDVAGGAVVGCGCGFLVWSIGERVRGKGASRTK
jgi:undecaprenyl-diphosphatase